MNVEKNFLNDSDVGRKFIIDKEFSNGGEVMLVAVYGKIFCRVKDLQTNEEWDTMCYRLTQTK